MIKEHEFKKKLALNFLKNILFFFKTNLIIIYLSNNNNNTIIGFFISLKDLIIIIIINKNIGGISSDRKNFLSLIDFKSYIDFQKQYY